MADVINLVLEVDPRTRWTHDEQVRLGDELEKRAFNELDSRYGGELWCEKYQRTFVDEDRLLMFMLVCEASIDSNTISDTFNKHWRDIQGKSSGESGVPHVRSDRADKKRKRSWWRFW